MSNNENGFAYENQVIKCLQEAKISGNIAEAAGSSSVGVDADMLLGNALYNLEIKLNTNAQMGGTSVKFDLGTRDLTFCSPLKPELEQAVRIVAEQHKDRLANLLYYLSGFEAEEFDTFPLTCNKETWESAKENKLLVNSKIPFDAEFIWEHYAKKNTDYIQIGGSGLFYLKNNPANLPIPQLMGELIVEMRTGRSGSKSHKSGKRRVGAGIRLQGRLKTKNVSPYSLDDPESIQKLLGFLATEKLENTVPVSL